MEYLTNVALLIKGDRIEKGSIVELSDIDAANFYPADITPTGSVKAPAAEEDAPETPISEMSVAELKDKAKALGLSTSGSKADLQERISLHLQGADAAAPAAEEESTDGE